MAAAHDPISLPESHHLRAAAGWLELGNAREAHSELDQLPKALREHPAVLELRWHAWVMAKRWDECLAISQAMMGRFPHDPEYWIWHGNGLYWSGRVEEASRFGENAIQKFPENWRLRFNLACYYCQMGRLPQAREQLQLAMAYGDADAIKAKAFQDPDLAPMRNQIAHIKPAPRPAE